MRLALALALLTAGCTGMVVIERPGCSVDRSVEVVRTAGQPDRTVIKSHRVCGDIAPAPEGTR